MAKEEVKCEYIVDLPSAYEVGFNVATPQYYDVHKRAVTLATTPKAAVGNIVFRTPGITQDVGRIIMAALRDSGRGTESYAFEVPVIASADRKPLSQLEIETSQEGFLAEEIAAKRGGTTFEHLKYARKLLEFWKQNRTNRTIY